MDTGTGDDLFPNRNWDDLEESFNNDDVELRDCIVDDEVNCFFKMPSGEVQEPECQMIKALISFLDYLTTEML